ncbi:hypothetical protein M7I_6288 [Glarea lozoyensis 74030]|uniref:Uncharacterized protein n=1 Tax=Glarea lozoyensis (strain ATCC 74030 / MF5533) TaxID=1104152 RepID=H0EU58_GLAL7|nr:hypothetical protein M7I_6288 [Glarea lozoyensis 74030]
MSEKQDVNGDVLYQHDIQSTESTNVGSSSNVSQGTTFGDDNSGRTPTPDLKGEKDISAYVTEKGIDEDVEEIPDDDPLLRDIPWQVRRVVSLFLVYDPQYPWYQALCQTALFETQKKQRESPSPVSRRQMIVFCAFNDMGKEDDSYWIMIADNLKQVCS